MVGARAAVRKGRGLPPFGRHAVATITAAAALSVVGGACAAAPGRRPLTGPAPRLAPRVPPATVARCSTTPDGADALSVAEAAALWPWCRGAPPMQLSTDGWQTEDRWARVQTPAGGAEAIAAGIVDPRSSPVVVSVEVSVPGQRLPHRVLVTLYPVLGAGTWGVDGVAVTS